MNWKHLRKPAVFVASLALAVGIAPLAAFAAEGDAAQDGAELVAQAEVQQDISINVKQPAVGDTLSGNAADAVSVADGNCSIEYAVWEEAELDPVEVVAGTQYTINLGLNAPAGDTFKANDSGQYAGTVKSDKGQVDRAVVSSANPSFMEVFIKIAAASGDNPAADEPEETDPAADDPKPDPTPADTKPAATDTDKAAADTEKAATDTAASEKTTSSTATSTSASTLPKTADSLPIALFGTMALVSVLALAASWRLRKN